MSAMFVFTTKTTQPRPQVFSVNSSLTCKNAAFFSGAPARAKRSWDRWSTSFRLVVTWLTERTYASTDCTGRVGETIQRKGGVSQACLAKSTSFTLDIHNMVNCQLSKQDSH